MSVNNINVRAGVNPEQRQVLAENEVEVADAAVGPNGRSHNGFTLRQGQHQSNRVFVSPGRYRHEPYHPLATPTGTLEVPEQRQVLAELRAENEVVSDRVARHTAGRTSARRAPPPRRAPPAARRPAAHSHNGAVLSPRQPQNFGLAQGLSYVPMTAWVRPVPFASLPIDERHMRHTTNWWDHRPRALNYGDHLSEVCNFFQFRRSHPEEVVRAVYRENYRSNRPYAAPTVRTASGKWVKVCGVLSDRVPPVSYDGPRYKYVVSIRNASLARLSAWHSDLPSIVIFYAVRFARVTVLSARYLEPGAEANVGLGQVEVETTEPVNFGALFEKWPCVMDHNGIFVLREDYNGPRVVVARPRSGGPPTRHEYPPAFAELIQEGDLLSQ